MAVVTYRPHYSIDDYLGWEGDWELWDGIPVAMSPAPNFRHQAIGTRLLMMLTNQLAPSSCPEDCQAVYECDWHVNDATVVRPDILIICEKPEGQWIQNRPEFIAEILSPSTREKDLVAKRDLYAANGVPFYLIIDPDDESVLLLGRDEAGAYRELPAEEAFDVHPGCRLQVNTAGLFE